jgi:hypothetical protein
LPRFLDQGFVGQRANAGRGVADKGDEHRLDIDFRQRVCHRLSDIGALGDRLLVRSVGMSDEIEGIFVREQRASQDQRTRNLDGVVDQEKDEVVGRGGIVCEPLGERDADRHLHVPCQPAQDLVHEFTLAGIQVVALDPVERRHGEKKFLALYAAWIGHEMCKPVHVTQIARRKTHDTRPLQMCPCRRTASAHKPLLGTPSRRSLTPC